MLSIFSIDPCVFHHPFSRALDEHSMGLFSTRMLILQHQRLLAAGSAPPGSDASHVCHSPFQRLAVLHQGLIQSGSLKQRSTYSRRSAPASICSNPSNSASVDSVFEYSSHLCLFRTRPSDDSRFSIKAMSCRTVLIPIIS